MASRHYRVACSTMALLLIASACTDEPLALEDSSQPGTSLPATSLAQSETSLPEEIDLTELVCEDSVEAPSIELLPKSEGHGYPPEAQYVDPQIGSRIARGLDGDRELVGRLMSTPGAAEQIQAYGLVLTEDEEESLLFTRIFEDTVIAYGMRLEDEDGFGGTRMNWASDKWFTPSSLTIWVTADRLGWIKEEFRCWPLAVPLEFEIVGSSIQELEDFVQLVTGIVHDNEAVLVLDDQSPAIRALVEAVRALPYVSVGYSVVENEILVYLEEGEELVTIDDGDPTTPTIRVTEIVYVTPLD